MNKEDMIRYILAQADGISNIVDDYNEDNIGLFMAAPDAILQKMARVLTDAYRHIEQQLGIYQQEFEKYEVDYD